jgi:hypothetical protein
MVGSAGREVSHITKAPGARSCALLCGCGGTVNDLLSVWCRRHLKTCNTRRLRGLHRAVSLLLLLVPIVPPLLTAGVAGSDDGIRASIAPSGRPIMAPPAAPLFEVADRRADHRFENSPIGLPHIGANLIRPSSASSHHRSLLSHFAQGNGETSK